MDIKMDYKTIALMYVNMQKGIEERINLNKKIFIDPVIKQNEELSNINIFKQLYDMFQPNVTYDEFTEKAAEELRQL